MHKFNIKTSKQVDKFFARHRDIAKRFIEKAKVMQDNPFDKSLDISSLAGSWGHYRLRIGKYRFLFEIIEQEILIYFYHADTRWGVYK